MNGERSPPRVRWGGRARWQQRDRRALATGDGGSFRSARRRTPSKRSSRKRKKTAKAGKRVGQNTVDAVWKLLVDSERPVASSEIASKLELNQSTVTSALQHLRAAKRIEMSGKSRLTRLVVAGTVTRTGERRFTRYTLK